MPTQLPSSKLSKLPIIKDSEFKKSISERQQQISKFDDPLVGLALMLVNIDAERAQEIGIH